MQSCEQHLAWSHFCQMAFLIPAVIDWCQSWVDDHVTSWCDTIDLTTELGISLHDSDILYAFRQGRHHRMDRDGHVQPIFARGCSLRWRRSDEFRGITLIAKWPSESAYSFLTIYTSPLTTGGPFHNQLYSTLHAAHPTFLTPGDFPDIVIFYNISGRGGYSEIPLLCFTSGGHRRRKLAHLSHQCSLW